MAAPRRPSSRTSSFASQESTASQDAALRGAATAFGRPRPNPRGSSGGNSTYTGTFGAVVAASTAGTASNPPTTEQWQGSSTSTTLNNTRSRESVNSSGSARNNTSESFQATAKGDTSSMAVPTPPGGMQSKSTSQHAALAAAARAPAPAPENNASNTPRRATTTKRPAAPPKPRRLSSYHGSKTQNTADAPTDSTSIAPTTSLVDLFEKKTGTPRTAAKRPESIIVKPSADLPLESPKPIRTSNGITSMIQMQVEDSKRPTSPAPKDPGRGGSQRMLDHDMPPKAGPRLADTGSSPTSNVDLSPAQTNQGPIPKTTQPEPTKARAPVRGRSGPETTYLEPLKSSQKAHGRISTSPSPLRHSTTSPIPIARTERGPISHHDAFSPSSASVHSIPAQYNLLHGRKATPKMSDDQIVNAMVASSLASSRQHSPVRSTEPPPLPSRRHKHHTLSFSRTPSPSKGAGLRKTLRATQSDASDEDDPEGLYPYSKRKVQKRLHKHPNKHHEGDRKRWRERVTEQERKRYEGVWAANKGLHSSFTLDEYTFVNRKSGSEEAQELREAVSEQVSNLVVRDIWSRSRLPDTVLEMVWDLVDERQVGRLNKEEFVVGLWLIDGRLKGKKLPVKVSESVWMSVRGLHGIKIRKQMSASGLG